MCLFPATLALLPGQPHQSPAVLHLNDPHCRTAEATPCRQQPASCNLPPFFQKKKKTSVVAGEWKQTCLFLSPAAFRTADLTLSCHYYYDNYIFDLFIFPLSISRHSCSNPVLRRNIILTHVAASKSKRLYSSFWLCHSYNEEQPNFSYVLIWL